MYDISLPIRPRSTSGARVDQVVPGTWCLEIPAGLGGQYRLAQLDDYTSLSRRAFRWRAPFHMSLRARVSDAHIPGTWGFGVWNDPFSFSLGIGGAAQRLPALPNAAWFFFAAPPNYLSFRDDLPAQGFLAATFRSLAVPSLILGLASPLAILALIPPVARLARRIARRWIHQDSNLLQIDPVAWHAYGIEWREDRVRLFVDDTVVLDTDISARGPLGMVIWVDNQYAALTPRGKIGLGFLGTPNPAWLEIAELRVG